MIRKPARIRTFCLGAAIAVFAPTPTDPPPPGAAPGPVPVQEVTVFKDGHAFVVRAGQAAIDDAGDVVLDELPAPVLGTFWPFCTDERARLHSVVVGRRDVDVPHTAMDVRELIEANVGAEVVVTESGRSYSATIAAVPEAESAERRSGVVLLKTLDGMRVVDFARIQDVTFKGDFESRIVRTEAVNRMTLRLDWGDEQPGATADVGMMYLQKGLRWIPSYKVVLDGKGRAAVSLQATLVNELVDLENVTTNLVIGVPRFAFDHTLDPIALQEAAAQLSPYFQQGSQTAYAFSNAIMTQTARMGEFRAPAPAPAAPDLGPEVEGSKSEDLFVFSVANVTLKKGERMVVPVTSFEVDYEDVYRLDVPMTPPREVWCHFNDQRKRQLAELFHAPKVEHLVRLTNKSPYPLTTAPALLHKGDRVIAQSMMTYTAVGASSDLSVTTAVDIAVTKSDRETTRDPKAERWRGNDYARIDLTGSIGIHNHGARTVSIEVSRHVLGNVDEASSDGAIMRVNLLEAPGQAAFGPTGHGYPYWWGWYSWPWWWHHFNGIGRVSWDIELEPGADVDLTYRWYYYWQ